jgi:hypothetical protein
MSASYPATAKNFTAVIDGVDYPQATHVNQAYDEITAVETALISGLAHDLKFTDATYDIGKSGATRPRHLYISGNAVLGGTVTLNGRTYTYPASETVNGVLRTDGSGTLSWAVATTVVNAYTATLTNVISTAVQTTFLSFSVPSMANGDVIEVLYSALKKNNKGSAGTVTIDVFYGANSVTQIAGSNWGNSATELKALGQIRMQRVGSDLWVQQATDVPSSVVSSDGAANVVVISAPTFGSAQTVSLKITLSAADATFYLKPQSAVVHHRIA